MANHSSSSLEMALRLSAFSNVLPKSSVDNRPVENAVPNLSAIAEAPGSSSRVKSGLVKSSQVKSSQVKSSLVLFSRTVFSPLQDLSPVLPTPYAALYEDNRHDRLPTPTNYNQQNIPIPIPYRTFRSQFRCSDPETRKSRHFSLS